MEVFLLLSILYVITAGIGLAAGLGWNMAKYMWPHVRPRLGLTHIWKGKYRGRTRWSFVMGKRVVCRIPFTTRR